MKEVSPKQAYELMQNDADYIYLDVRSTMEFDEAHPTGAVNVPLLNFTPGFGMTPNPDFVQTIEERQGLMICCVEEIAYRMGYIGPDDVRRIAEPMRKNSYGQYLLQMLEAR